MSEVQQQAPMNRKIFIITRITNLVTALALIGIGIAGVVFMIIGDVLLGGRFFLIFSPIFMILFGLLLIAAQFQIKLIMRHIGFLNSLIGRGVFNIYLSTSIFYYFSCGNDSVVLAWVLAVIVFVLGILYIILFFINCIIARRQTEAKQQMM